MKEKTMERITSSKIVRVAMAMALVLSVAIVPTKAYASGNVNVSIGKSIPYAGYETTQMSANGNDAYCIEPSLGVDRMVLAFLCNAYEEQELEGGDVRTVLHLHPALAPYKAAILPLSKKLAEPAKKLFQDLCPDFMLDYDETGSIGKRYRRQDEIGTPFCITLDFQTVGDDTTPADHCVTIRERDSMEQVRIPMSEVKNYIAERIKF